MSKAERNPVICDEHSAAWTRFCSDIKTEKNLEFYAEIIGRKALILAVTYMMYNSLEKAERNAKIPPRSGRAVLETALQSIKYHIGLKINIYN